MDKNGHSESFESDDFFNTVKDIQKRIGKIKQRVD